MDASALLERLRIVPRTFYDTERAHLQSRVENYSVLLLPLSFVFRLSWDQLIGGRKL